MFFETFAGKLVILFMLTFIPFLELRYSIPIGILNGSIDLPFGFKIEAFGLDILTVFLFCVFANIILGLFLYIFMKLFLKLALKIDLFRKIYDKKVLSAQKKLKPFIDKYGLIGLAIFIGIPLPGSGVYTGVLGATFFGYDFKSYFTAVVIGVFIAGILTTAITVGLSTFIGLIF